MTDKRMKRIIGHWTAGAGRASQEDAKHYHRLVEFDGAIINGIEKIADNIVTSDGDYAAHTLHLNTRSIGVAMCGMRGAIEQPFAAGPSPLNSAQFDVFCRMIADLCIEHAIAVTPETVLTHAEVELTLGVKQRGKWDIARLPWRPDLKGSRAVGDLMRRTVLKKLGGVSPVETNRPTLRFGMKGVAVAELQTDLAALRYFSGRIDGDFGKLTRASVLAFQADNDLATDGAFGPQSWTALLVAEPRPLRAVTAAEIDEESGTAQDALMSGRVGDIVGFGGAVGLAKQATEAADTASGLMGTLSTMVTDHWPALLLCGVCILGWFALRALGWTTRQRRVVDAQENRSLAR